MSMTPDEIEEFTLAHVSDGFIRRALKGVFRAHVDSWRHCRDNLSAGEAKNLLPYDRRARVETNLLAAAELHPELVASSVASQWWQHVEVRGGPVVLTSASTPRPCGEVRWSRYRETLAEGGQLRIFGDEPPPDAPLYVILLHTKYLASTAQDRRDHGHLPGAAYLAWPNGELKHHIHAVNLFDRYPEVVAENLPAEWEPEVRLRYVERSRRQAS